ncbi:MAG: transmembrane prediction [Planctomycetes bacterium RBG_13_46_10]|nr:MAG: transmembrane prediction [Planctomycetes bacterium RBG_13_46_10]
MTKLRWFIILFIIASAAVTLTFAQRFSYERRGRPVPTWEPDREFFYDVFTFARIRYSSGYGGPSQRGGGRGGRSFGRGFSGGSWATDYPDSDLNFSYRLHQLTSMEVNPDPVVLGLTDSRLVNYPFIYIVEPGRLVFSEEEVKALRSYLLNGGFLMVDDFWGQAEWENFYFEIKRVFPDREPVELPLSHPIFHAVFDIKEKPQIPSINVALAGRAYGITWEREDARVPHYKAIYDDKGRMMVIICHNTDLGDGWEREGENEWYFHEFSEKSAYPLGINIVFYAMTH